MANSQEKRLLTEFPDISTQQWEDVINKDLKGADYGRKLVWKTDEGFDVKPYYRAEDLSGVSHMGVGIAQFPYVRGVCKSNKWRVHQTIEVIDIKRANATALKAIAGGADSIGFCLSEKGFKESDIAIMLDGIDINDTELVFCGSGAKHLAVGVIARMRALNVEAKVARISFVIDPIINCISLKGKCNCGGDGTKCYLAIKKLIEEADGFKKMRFVGVNGQQFHNSGSTIVQELAFTLAVGHEYLMKLMDTGLTIDQAARTIRFSMAVSSNYFMEIAKFRAARMLWANIVGAYKPDRGCAAKMKLHAVTSKWNITAYDPYVNMLRGTTEAMSATIAGVHSLEITPFNYAYEEPTEFSARIARNVQLLLKNEAHFDNVTDPSGGSYYIENLTQSITAQAWSLFREVEDLGGYIAAFKSGFIQDKIEAAAAKKDMDIATRRSTLLGSNQYPNFGEVADKSLTSENVMRSVGCECVEKCELDTDGLRPLKPYRGSMAFEQMRLAVDCSNSRPMAFMLTAGALSMARARAQFACNFFACAGIQVVDNTYFADVAKGVEQAIQARADIVVLCAADDDYAELAPKVKELLGDKAILVVAGAPASQSELEAKGITHFISTRSNVLETLKSYLKELGI